MKHFYLTTLFMLVACHLCAQEPFSQFDIRQDMRRVADWQIAHFKEVKYSKTDWVNATFYLGLTRWAALAERENGDTSYYDWLCRVAEGERWQVGKELYHADYICVGQSYLDLYRRFGKEEMMKPTQARAEWVIEHPSKETMELDYGDKRTLERWTWCDALFMAPPVYARLYKMTGDKRYLRFMDKEYRATYNRLYDKEEHLFYRDHRYIGQKEANGQKVFWSRGNGWVVGGLVEILRELPEGHKSRKFYEKLFVELCTRIAECQQEDGFWRASLLDPQSYPSPETSGTGFFVYGFAYGINEGLLPRDKFMPCLVKGWKALLSAVEEDGKLGYVQPIGADPKKVTRAMTELYGPGAFLLAGTEIYRMADKRPALSVVSSDRVCQIAAMLPEHPEGLGLPCTDRAYWDTMRDSEEGRKLVAAAARSLQKGLPPFVDSLYLHLNKTNNRLPGEQMMNARYRYLWQLMLAECMENKGRFVPAICKGVEEMCRQKPWSIPAHDRDLKNYKGTDYSVDLVVATSGNAFAQCLYLLGDKLPAETRALAMCAFREKVFRPIRRCVERGKPFWWLKSTNNWNSVCLAGVTGAALALLPDREERAFFVAVAEMYQEYGMKGYADDGYCSEGVGYYNYGFGAYITLREEVCRATQGKVDFFRSPKFVNIARYGENIEILNGVCPAYSDCHTDATPDRFITDYCARALNPTDTPEQCRLPSMGNLSLRMIGMFPRQAWKVEMTPEMRQALETGSDPLRTRYEQSGIFIARPLQNYCRMGVSFKGGNNAENHNHNDVGSYAVVLGKQLIAGEMGGPHSYPGDFFGGRAYRYPIKNSFGHPVPLVDGRMQREGRNARGVVKEQKESNQQDSYVIDLSSAYTDVKPLQKLLRSFVYSRGRYGSFVVEDRYEAASPIAFETALTTRAQWKQTGKDEIELQAGDEKVIVGIEASGDVEFRTDTVEVNCPPYTRIGIALKEKAAKGFIRLTYLPADE